MSLHQKLVRHVFLPLALRRRGETAQLRYLKEFERTQFLSEEAIRDLQFQRLALLLRHAWDHCPFYRHRMEQSGVIPWDIHRVEDLRLLAPLEKCDIQEHGLAMIAANWPVSDLLANQTGGSTGTPVAFFLSRDRKCSRAAATLRHNHWAGWRFGDRTAVLWGAPRDRPDSGWRSRFRGRLLRDPLWLDAGCVTESALHEFHEALLGYRPRIIQAYAGAAVLFARFLEANGLRPHRPHAIVTSAEVLEDADRALLECVFGCPVFNRYGCREVSVIASECDAHQGLHVMAEGLLVEIETPAGPAAPGQVGSVLVTDLFNHAMPLIRYRIGDLASWASGTCSCGRHLPRLERVVGRVTDFLSGPEGRLVSGVFLATYVVAHRPSLGQVQIHQHEKGAVVYRVKPGTEFNPESDREYLVTATRAHLGANTRVEVELTDNLPPEPSGKYLFSHSTVTPEFLRRAEVGAQRPQ